MTAALSAEKILRELNELWVSLAQADKQEQSGGVLRACSMTLIVVTEETSESTPVGEVLAALMREHPSRVVVLRIANGATLDSRVFAECWMPFGRHQQICCEQIEISLSPGMIADVAALLPGIVAPDLPVVLWCRTASLLGLPEFREVLAWADKTIIDSSDFADPRQGLPQLIAARAMCRFADLNWTRLTRWREAIAQAFERSATMAKLANLSDLTITYKTPETPITAWYLAAWVREALGRPLRTQLRSAAGNAGRTIQEVTLSGPGISVSVTRTEGDSVQLHDCSLDSCAIFPPHPEYRLLSEELALLQSDALYDSVLLRAYELAKSFPEAAR